MYSIVNVFLFDEKNENTPVKLRMGYIFIGVLISFLILACIGYFYGLKFLFFKSNFGMVKHSFSGLGLLFKVPLSDWVFGATRLFMPIFILALVIKKYRASKRYGTLSEQRKLAKLALITIIALLS